MTCRHDGSQGVGYEGRVLCSRRAALKTLDRSRLLDADPALGEHLIELLRLDDGAREAVEDEARPERYPRERGCVQRPRG